MLETDDADGKEASLIPGSAAVKPEAANLSAKRRGFFASHPEQSHCLFSLALCDHMHELTSIARQHATAAGIDLPDKSKSRELHSLACY